MYVLDGNLDVYVGNEVFQVGPGEYAFLPLSRSHAFLIRSPEIRMLVFITPGGFTKAFAPIATPAEKMEIPMDSVTYAKANLEETMKIFLKHGVHFSITGRDRGRDAGVSVALSTVVVRARIKPPSNQLSS